MPKNDQDKCLKIYDKKIFSREVSMMMMNNPESSCMEIIFEHAENIGIDHEMIPSLLSPRLKDLLYREAVKKNMFNSKPSPLEIEEIDD